VCLEFLSPQGVARLIDSYTEGLIEKDEFEPRVTRLRQRIAHIEEQCETLADEELLQREMRLIVSRLDDFAAQVGRNLDDLEWGKKREIIRALVRRVEVGLEHVHVVFRVDAFPGESDPEKKSLQLCRGSSEPCTFESVFALCVRCLDDTDVPRHSLVPLRG
jgi:site-specific DNA recombinase